MYRLTDQGAQLGRSIALAGDEDAAMVLDALLEGNDDWFYEVAREDPYPDDPADPKG